jgi:CubicO group peptidase (beta-lactamase class C family)
VAVFEGKEPISAARLGDAGQLVIRMQFPYGEEHVIGRFRLSVTNKAHAGTLAPLRALLATRVNAWAKLALAHALRGEAQPAARALEKARASAAAGKGSDAFLLALAHGKLEHKLEAHQCYDRAFRPIEQETDDAFRQHDIEVLSGMAAMSKVEAQAIIEAHKARRGARSKALEARSERPENKRIPDPDALADELEEIRQRQGLPALAVALVIGDKVVLASAVGFRKMGDPTPATREDRFHTGSVTKPMTASLIGALVDAGKMRWSITLAEMFPELREQMQPAYRTATLMQLPSHTSGLPYEPTRPEPAAADTAENAMKHRMIYVVNALADKPVAPPGTKSVYSGGAILAAAYAERIMKRPYEELMQEYVFRKLGMTSAADFRMVTLPDKVDGPWEHVIQEGQVKPVPALQERWRTRAPVGGVCCSVIDLARFASAHLQGARGSKSFLAPETFRTLQTGPDPPGWAPATVKWAHGPVLWHNGSNGKNYALVHVVPDENDATCVMTNVAGPTVHAAAMEVHHLLVQEAVQQRAAPK